MNFKKRPKCRKGLVLLILGLGLYTWATPTTPEVDLNEIPESAIIEYSPEFNYRQTANDCGPFNVAAVVRALTGEEVDSQEFAEDMKWRLPNNYTLPWGMERQLKENGLVIEIPNIKSLSDEEKVYFLQGQLADEKPVIVLGEREGYEHYVTVLGFDQSKDELYVYDSLYEAGSEGRTVDDNGPAPGNRTYTSESLLDFWRGGGMYGLYHWYLIVASFDDQ